MPDIDPYKILQVDSEAEDEVIQAAYRRLARKYHPDLATTSDAASRMAAINAAWELIGEPAKRQAFDRKREPLKTTPTPRRAGPIRGAARRCRTAAGRRHAARVHVGAGAGVDRSKPSSGSAPQPETVSRDWTSGRSTQGGGYEESMRSADGFGAAGPPPGRPSGTVLNFGRYAGWSLGEVARMDLEYIEWLDRAPIGRNYRQEIDEILRTAAGGWRPRPPRPSAEGCSAVASRRRRGRRRRSTESRPDRRSTTQPMVVPWTSSVNRTTPKVISWSSARCGTSAGRDSAIATATAPRRPAQNRTWSHRAGAVRQAPGGEPVATLHRAAGRPRSRDRPGCRRSPTRSGRATRGGGPAGSRARRAGRRRRSAGRRRTPRRCRWRRHPSRSSPCRDRYCRARSRP